MVFFYCKHNSLKTYSLGDVNYVEKKNRQYFFRKSEKIFGILKKHIISL